MVNALTSRNTLLYFWLPISFVLGGSLGYLFNAGFCSISINKRSQEELGLYANMHKLWSNHVFWMRSYLVNTAADLPATQKIAARLLKNQENIGNAIASFYGTSVGTAVTDLLQQHILITVDLITAMRLDNSAQFAEINTKWYKNADDIAKALSDINSAWSFESLQRMMHEHLKLTTQEISAHLKKDWEGSIQAFDKTYDKILELADMLTQGLVKAFPARI